MKESESFINLSNARVEEQRNVMEAISVDNVCPFCPEHLEHYHKEEIFRKGAHWILTRNQWPYKNTDLHLLAIAAYHAEALSDLKPGSFDELQDHFAWAEGKFNIKAGGIAMRFGDVKRNGATVNHLHAHLIVPSEGLPPDEKVRFKIS